MPRVVRAKLVLICLSLFMITFVLLAKWNFGKKDLFVKYQKLTWDNFQGTPKPFSTWAAGINSNVHVQYDSTLKRLKSYSRMNTARSWKKRDLDSKYTLNHEQYHFNLTQYYALKLDEQLKTGISTQKGLNALVKIQSDLGKAQSLYDYEADHGSRVDMQGYWEFKIDSLLISLKDPLEKTITDLYAELNMLNIPGLKKYKEKSKKGIFEITYHVKNYGVDIRTSSVKYPEPPQIDLFEGGIKLFYSNQSQILTELELAKNETYPTIIATVRDTLQNLIIYDKWVTSNEYIHNLRLQTDDTKATVGYEKIFKGISSGFGIQNTDSIWIEIAENQPNYSSVIEEFSGNVEDGCMVIDKANTIGWKGRILTNESRDLLIPYTPMQHSDSLISEIILLNDGTSYTFDLSDSLILKIPNGDLKGVGDFLVGYTLKSDTINKCTTFYNEQINYTFKKN